MNYELQLANVASNKGTNEEGERKKEGERKSR